MKRQIRKRPGSKVRISVNHGAIPPAQQLNPTRKVSTGQAQKILSDSGINIEKDDTAKVLELMYQLAKLIVNQNFKK
ncbi:hypothetical protein [Pedobacter sp. UBA5917]|jgi:hypothetical protein|uniref:hypothetical protein n=1 Tax=Pedobacter sp. UBA5917 TaxID=1947061 RepID=UPI0025E09616|nr:hypothetical protein [Pedobacter sp. UBA5917]